MNFADSERLVGVPRGDDWGTDSKIVRLGSVRMNVPVRDRRTVAGALLACTQSLAFRIVIDLECERSLFVSIT